MSRLFAVLVVWCAVVFAAAACGALPRSGSAGTGITHATPTPAGSVIARTARAGKVVRAGTRVNLVVSRGR